MSALVTPGNLRSALAVTRSLGRQSVAVTVADERSGSLAGASRYCHGSVRVPSLVRSGEAFISAIREELARGKHRVVVPADDVTLSRIARARSNSKELECFPFPSLRVFRSRTTRPRWC